MNEKKCPKLIKLLLPIIALSSCVCKPETIIELPALPLPPVYPVLTWIDVFGYYGLDENCSDFDDLQDFFDEYDGYLEKMSNLKALYGTANEGI